MSNKPGVQIIHQLMRSLILSMMLAMIQASAYTPTWEELDARPLPAWYDEAKFGIFIHWGVFSVPSVGSEWFWYQWQDRKWQNLVDFVGDTETQRFSYADYAQRFTAELYHPEQWADVFANSGAQYIVLTSKHHEGFCNWDSRSIPTTWNWNAMEVGPRRDLLGDLTSAVKNATSPMTNKPLKMGFYHSLFEWFNPMYVQDKAKNYTTQDFVNTKAMPELYDLVKRYEPELIWSDGEWEASSDYWKSTEFLYWYGYNSTVAETAVWNDRWGKDCLCKHGSYVTCHDRYSPDKFQERKWENAFTIDKKSWGLNRNATYADYLTVKEIIDEMVKVIAFNGNFLLNIGPGADGTISPIFVDRLLGMGDWLRVNGEAIYSTKPWTVSQSEPKSSVFYTTKDSTLYVIFTEWPKGSLLRLEAPQTTDETEVTFLGLDGTRVEHQITTRETQHGSSQSKLLIQLPQLTPNLIPCQHAWVLKMTGLRNVGTLLAEALS